MSNKSPTYLFRPARQAVLPPAPLSTSTSTSSKSFSSSSATRTISSISSRATLDIERRQAVGTCRADEATCPQAGWCCNKDETCSLEGGAFFCCPTGAGKEGCVRICAAGDFQCGGTTPDSTGICCENGQTCIGGDTPLPFCADSGTSSSRRTTATLSTSQTNISSQSDSHISTTTSSYPTLTLNPNPSPSTTTITAPNISSPSASPTATSTSTPGSGLSIPAQISAIIIIPLVIITLIASCIFRHRRRKQHGTRIQSADFTEQNNASGRTASTGTTVNAADGLSFYSAYSSYPKTPPPPPPTFSAARVVYGRDTKEEDGEVMSLHERYMMEGRMFRTPTPQSPVGPPGVSEGVGRGL